MSSEDKNSAWQKDQSMRRLARFLTKKWRAVHSHGRVVTKVKATYTFTAYVMSYRELVCLTLKFADPLLMVLTKPVHIWQSTECFSHPDSQPP